MEIDDKIILCEVAREAINGRFREWLKEERLAKSEGNQQRAIHADFQQSKLLALRSGLRVAKIAENQRIVKGDFEPKSPS